MKSQLFIILSIIITGVCFSQSNSLNALDVLDAYQQTMEKSLFHRGRSAYKEECKIEDKNIYNTSEGYITEVSTAIRKTIFLHDSNRIDCRHESEICEFNRKPVITKRQYLLDDEHYFQVLNESPPFISMFTKNLRRYAHASLGTTGNAFEGYMEGDSHTPLWEVLKEEHDLRLRDEMEIIDGYKTYVLEAQTNHGHYTLWVDPNSGFNLRRCIVHRKENDLIANRPLPLNEPPTRLSDLAMVEHIFSFVSVKIKNFDGLFLPVEGIITIKRKYSDGREHSKQLVYKRYDIDMDPDFSKFENAFDFVSDIPNGTPIFYVDAPGGNFEHMWQDGRVVPINIQPESLLGKPSEMKNLGIKSNETSILEVIVVDSLTKEPVEDANVAIEIPDAKEKYGYEVDEYGSVIIKTDNKGISRISLAPGESGTVLPRNRGYYPPDRKSFTIEKDKTTSIKFDYVPLKFVGIVRDEEGNLLEGINVLLTNVGREVSKTDSEGRFEVEWDMIYSRHPTTAAYLIARDEERNICAVERITKPDQKFDLKLKPGLTLTGKVVDPNGKGIDNAGIRVALKGIDGVDSGLIYTTTIDSNTIQTDLNGIFEIRAIPSDFMYNIYVRARDYGKANKKDFSSSDAINNCLDTGTFILSFLDHSVSGIVVDIDGKPVTNAKVSLYASLTQPDRTTQTDKDGKFKIENIGSGTFKLWARSTGERDLVGDVDAQADDTNVMIVVSGDPFKNTDPPKSLIGKKFPQLKNFNIEQKLSDLENKNILICFFDYEQRPSRNCMMQLSKRAKELKSQDVEIVAVHASKIEQEKLDEWLKKNSISFPVGMIEANEEQVRFNLGIKSLPWLILTDKEHIVQNEGFSINELEEKLK